MNEVAESLPQIGLVEWIGVAAHTRSSIQAVDRVAVGVGTGLEGEHHAKSGKESKRQVTLIQQEHLPVIAALCGRELVRPEQLRRNIVVSGINLVALKERRFRIGDVVLEGTGSCAPCSRMEENLGPGGYNAMRGHGGITTRVLHAGTIRIGDSVQLDTTDTEDDGQLTTDN